MSEPKAEGPTEIPASAPIVQFTPEDRQRLDAVAAGNANFIYQIRQLRQELADNVQELINTAPTIHVAWWRRRINFGFARDDTRRLDELVAAMESLTTELRLTHVAFVQMLNHLP